MAKSTSEMTEKLNTLKSKISREMQRDRLNELHKELWICTCQLANDGVPLNLSMLSDALSSFNYLRSSQSPPNLAELQSLLERYTTAEATTKRTFESLRSPSRYTNGKLLVELPQSDVDIAAAFNRLVQDTRSAHYPFTRLLDILSVYVAVMNQRNLTLLSNTFAWDIFLTLAATHSSQTRTWAMEILNSNLQGKIRNIFEENVIANLFIERTCFLTLTGEFYPEQQREIDNHTLFSLNFLVSATLYSPEKYLKLLIEKLLYGIKNPKDSLLATFFQFLEKSEDPKLLGLMAFLVAAVDGLKAYLPQPLLDKIAQQANIDSEIHYYQNIYLSQQIKELIAENEAVQSEDLLKIVIWFCNKVETNSPITHDESQFFLGLVLAGVLQNFRDNQLESDLESICEKLPTCLRTMASDLDLFNFFMNCDAISTIHKTNPTIYGLLAQVFQILEERARTTANLTERLDSYVRITCLHIVGFDQERLNARVVRLVRAEQSLTDSSLGDISLGSQQHAESELTTLITKDPEALLGTLERICKVVERDLKTGAPSSISAVIDEWLIKQAIQVKMKHPELKGSDYLEKFLSSRLEQRAVFTAYLSCAESSIEMRILLGYWKEQTFPIVTLFHSSLWTPPRIQQLTEVLIETQKFSGALVDVAADIANVRSNLIKKPEILQWISSTLILEDSKHHFAAYLEIASALNTRIATQRFGTSATPEFTALLTILRFLKQHDFPQERYQAILDAQLTFQSHFARYRPQLALIEHNAEPQLFQLAKQLNALLNHGANPSCIQFQSWLQIFRDATEAVITPFLRFMEDLLIALKPKFPLPVANQFLSMMTTFVMHSGQARPKLFVLMLKAGFPTENLQNVLNACPHEDYKHAYIEYLARQIKLSETPQRFLAGTTQAEPMQSQAVRPSSPK